MNVRLTCRDHECKEMKKKNGVPSGNRFVRGRKGGHVGSQNEMKENKVLFVAVAVWAAHRGLVSSRADGDGVAALCCLCLCVASETHNGKRNLNILELTFGGEFVRVKMKVKMMVGVVHL